jgi:hypothetical protein
MSSGEEILLSNVQLKNHRTSSQRKLAGQIAGRDADLRSTKSTIALSYRW